MEQLNKYFLFRQRGTNLRTEILAGATTFLSMMYIVIVNPTTFSAGGMDFGGVYVATIIATIVGTLIMGALANYPIAIAPGLGINAYLVYVVILSQGVSWQQALGAAAIASGIFTLLSLTQFREMFINAIPESLKKSIAAGIGLFVALIGFRSGGIVVDSPATLITLGDLGDPKLLLTVVGLIFTMVLMVKEVNGAIFIGMVFTAVVSFVLGYWTLPESIFSMPSGFDQTFMQLSFDEMPSLSMVIFTLLLVTLFDTAGTMLGVGQQAGLIRDGKFPNLKSALLADSVGSFVGAFAGTGPTSSFVESGTGVAAGGRTGFASIVTAFLFLLMLFCVPLAKAFSSMPAVTAPALIIVGFLMMMDVRSINWDYIPEAFPSFVTVMIMPLSYSITTGVGAGFILYVVLNFCAGRRREIHPLMYIFALLFFLQFTIMKL